MPTIYQDPVTIGTMLLNDPVNGDYPIRCDILDGWKDTADLSVVITEQGISDGAVWGPRFPAKEKYLNLGGYYLADSRAAAEQVMDYIVRAIAVNTELTLIRYEPVPKKMTVKLSGKIEFSHTVDNGFRFQCPLVAQDPNKYGLDLSTATGNASTGQSTGGRSYPKTYPLVYVGTASTGSGVVTINNAGTVASAPLSRIIGPITTGWSLNNNTTGERLSFATSLTSDQVLEIDHKRHTATVSGLNVVATKQGTWWDLDPGINNIVLSVTEQNPTAQFTITAASAWR
jgi:Phage tail protein